MRFIPGIIVPVLVSFIISASCIKQDESDKQDDPSGNIVSLKKHLVAHWLYNDTDTFAHDKSGNEFNGQVYGKPSRYNGFVSAFNFDGKDDYLSIPDKQNPPPEEIRNLETGSISVWFKVDSIPLEDGIMPIFYYGSRDNCYNMFDASNQGLIIEVGHSPVHYRSKRLYFTLFMNGCKLPSLCYDSNFNLDEGKWYHFVAVVGDDYNTGYLNGKEITNRYYNFGNSSTSEFFADARAHEALHIGKGYWNQRTVYFNGQIDDIRIYNKDINSTEVSYLFSQRQAGAEN